MTYVEWLRVRGCLKWTGVALGVLLLIGIVVRVALVGRQDYMAWAFNLKSDPGAKITETTLPDGGRRTAIDDPAKQVRVIVYDRGWQGKTVDIYDYSENGSSDLKNPGVVMGSVNVNTLPSGHGQHIVIKTNGDTDFLNYMVNGAFVAFIVATVLGAPFAREGDGHLEIALTKPVSRLRFSIEALVTDAAGIVAAFFTTVVVAIVAQMLFEVPHIVFTKGDWLALIVGILFPTAWYAMLTAATASMRRGYGVILGLSLPIAAAVFGLSLVHPNGNAVLAVVHDVAWVLSFLDPLKYATIHGNFVQVDDSGHVTAGFGYAGQAIALAALTLLYGAVSVLQWRRIEA